MLRSKLNPHFIKNTSDTTNLLNIKSDKDKHHPIVGDLAIANPETRRAIDQANQYKLNVTPVVDQSGTTTTDFQQPLASSIYHKTNGKIVSTDLFNSQMNQYLEDLEKHDFFSGIVYVKHGDQIYHKAFGTATLGEFATENAPFCIGSVGKLFTAVGIHQLVQSKTISIKRGVHPNKTSALDVPISHLFKSDQDFKTILTENQNLRVLIGGETKKDQKNLSAAQVDELIKKQPPITLRKILEHKAGLINNLISDSDSILRNNKDIGRNEAYSNVGYQLLGGLIGYFSDQPYENYIQENVCPSLSKDLPFPRAESDRKGMLSIYEKNPPPPVMGMGCHYRTATELSRFMSKLQDGEFGFSPDTLGDAIVTQTKNGVEMLGHQGGVCGAEIECQYIPRKPSTHIILNQNENLSGLYVLNDLSLIANGEEPRFMKEQNENFKILKNVQNMPIQEFITTFNDCLKQIPDPRNRTDLSEIVEKQIIFGGNMLYQRLLHNPEDKQKILELLSQFIKKITEKDARKSFRIAFLCKDIGLKLRDDIIASQDRHTSKKCKLAIFCLKLFTKKSSNIPLEEINQAFADIKKANTIFKRFQRIRIRFFLLRR